MANTSVVYARIDTGLKDHAEVILSQLGISPSSAIQMFYSQIILQQGMPFDLRLAVPRKPGDTGDTDEAGRTKEPEEKTERQERK